MRAGMFTLLIASTMSLMGSVDHEALGDVVIAGHGVGLYEDLKIVRRFVQTTDIFTPDMETHNRYKPYVRYYAQVFDKIRSIFQDLQGMQKPQGG